MKTTPSTLSPLEAYEALMLFARRRGEGALRLAMHAAVPQSFRPDLLHLLKLNFLPRELHDPAAEADVLFSPLCEEVGRGYFEFGPHVRSLLLDNLAANYVADRTPRIARVANFLLFYVEQMERHAAGGLDRLWRDYLEVQRWVALAFLDPDAAARQLAAALKGSGSTGGEFAARLRLGGLASALSSPLVKYRHVLNYAAGLQALEAGDHVRAQTLLSGLGDEELNVGGILLRPASELLRAYSVQSPEPTQTPTPEPSDAAPPKHKIFLSYAREDWERVGEAYRRLMELGYDVWLDSASIRVGESWDEALRAAMDDANVFIFFLSRHTSDNRDFFQSQLREALKRAEERPENNFFIIPALLEQCEIPPELAAYNAVDLSAEDGWRRLEEALDRVLKPTLPRSEAEEREEKVRAIAALAGSDNPQALETLTEAVWRDEDRRVRLAAVNALSKNRSESALETLLVAAGDEDYVVRRVAAEALLTAPINAVLIFGFFGTDRVENRDALREELRRRDYVPLVFPFTRPPHSNTADIIRAVAPLTRFAIAEMTASPDIEAELAVTLELFLSQTRVPLVPLSLLFVSTSTLDMELHRKYPSVLRPHAYQDSDELHKSFDMVVTRPVAAKLREISERSEPVEHAPNASPSEVEPEVQLPSFTEDVYISYAEPDNQPPVEGEQGWVDTLHERLKVRLEQLTGGPVKIWHARNLSGDAMLGDILGATLSQTALFVAIVTPLYVRSEWCLNVLRNFVASAATQGVRLRGGRSRVFKVVKSPAEEEPEGLRELPGYQLFEYDEARRESREFNPNVTPNKVQRYWDRLNDLVWDIKLVLDELKHEDDSEDSSETLEE